MTIRKGNQFVYFVRVTTNSLSVLCKGNHKPLKCTKVVDPKERLAIVRRENLCFNCLAKHKATQCHLNLLAESVKATSYYSPAPKPL